MNLLNIDMISTRWMFAGGAVEALDGLEEHQYEEDNKN